MKDFCKLAEDYRADVLSGKILACRWVHLACERQIRDETRLDFPYYFDREAANTCCAFLELWKHVQGDKAGQRLVLEPWQANAITCTMGWRRKDNGKRRYRRFFLEVPKGSGKSFISSCLALYFLAADGLQGSTCVSAARNNNQARLVFDVAREAANAAPDICSSFGIKVFRHSITVPSSASTFTPCSSQAKSLAGKILTFASVDELEMAPDNSVLDAMQRGCDKTTNSLCSTIQHAGTNLLSPGYTEHVTATKILSGEMVDERTWCIIYSAEGVDWKSPEAIRMSNPNLGISVYEQTLFEAQARAIALPEIAETFKSYNLCLWEDSCEAKQWIMKELVDKCMTDLTTMEQLKFWAVGEHEGINSPDTLRPFVIGQQRTSLQEPAVLVYCCKGYLDGVEHYYLFPRYYEPAANDDEQLADAVLAENHGFITYGAQVGNADGYALKALAHDDYFTPSPRLEKNGISPLTFHRTARTYSPVMDFFMSLAIAGRVHFSDETLAAHLLGIYAKKDLNLNSFPRRANVDKSIDAAIAAFYSLRLAMVPSMLSPPANDGVVPTFIYEDGTVKQPGPDGSLITVSGPLEVKSEGPHPGDRQ